MLSHHSSRSRARLAGKPLSWALACLCLLVMVALAGCSSAPLQTADGVVMDMDADSAIVHGPAADARTSPEGKSYEYRAVCFELGQHDGNALVMSKWGEDPEVARKLGDYHGNFKEKGHHWVLERRVKH